MWAPWIKKHYSSLFLYLYWNIVIIIIIILSLNMRKSDMKMCKNKINKYTPSPETTVTHVIEISPFPPEKRFLINNLFSFSHFCLNIPPFFSHRSFYMFTRWVFSIPFGCPLDRQSFMTSPRLRARPTIHIFVGYLWTTNWTFTIVQQ